MRATVLTGARWYGDAWHDFTATSVEVARVLEETGLDVAVRALMPQGVAAEVADSDLVVVNAGAGDPHAGSAETADDWGEAFAALRAYRAQGGPVLALHAAAHSLDGLEEWPWWVGGRWVRGRSTHPPLGDAHVQVSDPDHPVTAGLAPFTVLDERYCHLDRSPDAKVLLHHDHEGAREPLVWVLERDGARTVYDALGHDVRSYASPARVDLLRREVRWLLEPQRSPGKSGRTEEEKPGQGSCG